MNSGPTDIDKAISLSELLEQDSFSDVCKSFFDLFGVPIRLYDSEGKLLSEKTEPNSVCNAMQKFSAGRKACNALKTSVAARVPSDFKAVPMDCISGCRYVVTPLIYSQELVGRLIFGPYLPAELEQISTEQFRKDSGFDSKKFMDSFSQVRPLNRNAAKRILRALKSVLDIIIFNGHRTYLTSQMHIASIRESYRELQEKNKQIEETKERLQEFDRLRSAFLATVSHELRTPLTSIIGYSEMLFEGITGELSDEQKQSVNTIKTKGEELLNLISALLDFSQMETGHLELHRKKVAPGDPCRTALKKIKPLAERRGVKIHITEEKELPGLFVDPDRIYTALYHVIENAVKFSPPGGEVTVEVRMAPASTADVPDDGLGFVLMASPDMIEYRIIDKGPGIAEEQKEKIFSPFHQIEDSTTREHGGAGLGLTIMRQFVEAHGGRISVGGNIGKGSIFTVRLPVTDAHE